MNRGRESRESSRQASRHHGWRDNSETQTAGQETRTGETRSNVPGG